MKLTIVTDAEGWFVPYAKQLAELLVAEGHEAAVASSYDEIPPGGDASFFLSCTRIAHPETLARSRHNLVVHQSDLPRGRGWSPLAWQVLEGRNEIPVCLFEAEEGLDEGDVYYRAVIRLEGHELVDELRRAQAASAIELCLRFAREYPDVAATPQEGEPTYYARRTPADGRLDPSASLAEQFDLIRISDNERYPVYFELRGHTYELRVVERSS